MLQSFESRRAHEMNNTFWYAVYIHIRVNNNNSKTIIQWSKPESPAPSYCFASPLKKRIHHSHASPSAMENHISVIPLVSNTSMRTVNERVHGICNRAHANTSKSNHLSRSDIQRTTVHNIEKGVTTFTWYKILIQLKKHSIFVWIAVW